MKTPTLAAVRAASATAQAIADALTLERACSPSTDPRWIFAIQQRTVSEANKSFASRAGMFAKAGRIKKQREASKFATLATLRKGPKWPGFDPGVGIRITRHAPTPIHVEQLDDDNLRSALKATRDGIAEALGIDDGDRRVIWDYCQRRTPWRSGVYFVTVGLFVLPRAPGGA